MRRACLRLSIAACAACAGSAPAARQATPADARADLPDLRAERAALLAADSALAALGGERGLAALLATFADDVYYLEPGRHLLRGRDSAAAFLAGSPGTGDLRVRWRAVLADVSSDATLGYTVGDGTVERHEPGTPPAVGHARYAAAWRKVGGAWRVAAFLRVDAPSALPATLAVEAEVDSPPYAGQTDLEDAGAAATREAVTRADAEFAEYSAKHGLTEGFATYAARDAFLLSGAYGPAAIRAAFAGAPGLTARWAPVGAEGAASGDLGYTVGTAEFTSPAATGRQVTYSKYLTVWTRQPGGEWRWVLDGGNASPPPPGVGLRLTHEAARDLTGDGRPERVVVVASGARYDSLDVRLEVRTPDDSLRYLARWNTRWYFKYEPLVGRPPAEVERIVRDRLAALVADSAFAPRTGGDPAGRRAPLDAEAIRYDVAEHAWRLRHATPDTVALAPDVQGAISAEGVNAHRTRAAALAAELRGRPQYTYYAGGEETYTIAWSDRERRFVRVFACC